MTALSNTILPPLQIIINPSKSSSSRNNNIIKPETLLSLSTSLPKLLQTLSFLLKSGHLSHPHILTKLIPISSHLRSLPLLLPLLLSLPPPPSSDTFLFNTLIRHSPSPALSLLSFSLLLRLSLPPNRFTFPFLLKSCSRHPHLLPHLHAAAIKFSSASDPFVLNTLIHAYASSPAHIPHARQLFDRTPHRTSNRVTWSAMISGLVRSGNSDEALRLFRRMQAAGVLPDEVTLLTVLTACADLGALELTRWIASYIERRGNVARTVPLCNALIDALAKCGDVDGAVELFTTMKDRTIVSWTAVIDGLATHGRGREAVSVFEAMKKEAAAAAAPPPDDVVFIGVLTACSHAGLVEEGRAYFIAMTAEFGIAPKIEHYGCMVDMLARAGLVEEASTVVETMPMEANPVIWRTLIAACKVHGKLELGERITKELLAREPTHSSNYVLLSNVYALTQRWEKKMEIRRTMSRRGLQKVPGCSLLELDGEMHEFVAGDESHPHYAEIYRMAVEMARELKKAGYVAATSEVLLDIDEEDKEDALHWHSEKLAIAFALLRTAPGTQIRVVKNLRVCADCHSATKVISRVYRREILVRDRTRFHRFKEGVCSCNDFW